MAIGVFFEGSGVSQAQYDQVLNQVAPGNRPPAGLLYHVAGPTDGGFRVIEVWESQEALDRFVQERLGQALQQANINVMPQTFAVHNIMKP